VFAACKAQSPYFDLWPVWLYLIFSTLSYKRHDIRKKVMERQMCVLISPQLLSETFSILRRTERDIKMYIGLLIKYPLFLSYFSETWAFSTYFRKILKISNFMKIGPSFPCGRMDRHDESNNRLSQFCESA
jgi:hypothetical protein